MPVSPEIQAELDRLHAPGQQWLQIKKAIRKADEAGDKELAQRLYNLEQDRNRARGNKPTTAEKLEADARYYELLNEDPVAGRGEIANLPSWDAVKSAKVEKEKAEEAERRRKRDFEESPEGIAQSVQAGIQSLEQEKAEAESKGDRVRAQQVDSLLAKQKAGSITAAEFFDAGNDLVFTPVVPGRTVAEPPGPVVQKAAVLESPSAEGKPSPDPEAEQGRNPGTPEPAGYQPEIMARPVESETPVAEPTTAETEFNHDIDVPVPVASLNEERKQMLLEKKERAEQHGDFQLSNQIDKLVKQSDAVDVPADEIEGRFQGLRSASIQPNRGSGGDIHENNAEGERIEPEAIKDVPDDPNFHELEAEAIDPEADAQKESQAQLDAWKKKTSILYLDARGAFYQVSLRDKPTAGFYAIEELNEFLVDARVENDPSGPTQPILIQSVETTQSDIIGMVNCLENVKVVYTFGQNLGNVGIVGEILLGPLGDNALGTEASGVRQLMNFFEKYRASNWRDAVKVSCLGESFFVYLTGLRLLRVDPDLHIMPFQLTGILLDLNREKINPASKVVTEKDGPSLETALSVYAPTPRSSDQTGGGVGMLRPGESSNTQAKPGESNAGDPGNSQAQTYDEAVAAGIEASREVTYDSVVEGEITSSRELSRLRSEVAGLKPLVLRSSEGAVDAPSESFSMLSWSDNAEAAAGYIGTAAYYTSPVFLYDAGAPARAQAARAVKSGYDSGAQMLENLDRKFDEVVGGNIQSGAAYFGGSFYELESTLSDTSRRAQAFSNRLDTTSVITGSNTTAAERERIRQNWKIDEARSKGVFTEEDAARLGKRDASEVIELRAIQRKGEKFADTKGLILYSVEQQNDQDLMDENQRIANFRQTPERQAAVEKAIEPDRKRIISLISQLESSQAKEDYSKPGAPERVDTNILRAQFGLPPREGTTRRRP